MSGDHKTIINGNPSEYVKLNVGGHLYYTTIATLTAKPDTMLRAMFSGRLEVLTDSEGNILQNTKYPLIDNKMINLCKMIGYQIF